MAYQDNHETHKEIIEECPTCRVESSEDENVGNMKLLLIILSAVLFSMGLFYEFVLEGKLVALSLFIITAVICGFSIARKGVSSLLKKRVSINLLIIVAAVGAFLIGQGPEGAAVVLLFYIAEFFEEYASERAKKSIQSIMSLAPETASVKKDEKEEEVHVHNVEVDNIVVVRPGEKIPLDGIVQKGVSSVNQAPITGESLPVTKQSGDEVYAGTINNEVFLRFK